jgi:hypothetical protein
MKISFQTIAHFLGALDPQATKRKKLVAKPRRNTDLGAIRKKIVAKYSKTLAYLAK